ncbi:MAG: CBS domain-containing protein [Candidatus Glassbacteria bacterium]|nr:CBS domain-containing protein [Candidatus Glassbacteria bacterium]
MKVKEIMTREVVTVHKDLSIRRLIKLLDKNKITGAPVIDEQGKLIGIVSSKDVIRAIDHLIRVHVSIDEQKDHKGMYNWVEGVMNTNVITADEEDDVRQVFGTMVQRKIHRIPVVREGKPVGIISSQDACKIVAGVA